MPENNPTTTPTPAAQEPTPGNGGEVTFTQAQVDALIAREKQKATARATKGMPTEEELTAFRTWQANQPNEQQLLSTVTGERDAARTELSTVKAELEQLRRANYIASKGITGDDAEFIAFKAAKLVNDKTTFEQAVDTLTAERQKVTFDWTAPVGDGSKKNDANSAMNALIRGALK